MENFKDWIPLLAGIAAFIGIFYKREEVLSLRHKDFSARLDATVRFFNEFYGKQNEKKLVLDRAAQDVVKLDLMDFKFLCYLIKLDEKFLIKLEDLVHHYSVGHEFIDYSPSKNDVDINSFILKVPKNRTVKKQNIIYNAQYFLFAFIACIPFLISPWISQILFEKKTPLIFTIALIIMMLASLMTAVVALLQSSSLAHANKFIEKIKKADRELNS
ncbi:hypothetical protein [Acinetobacter sp. ANC 4648]|uniref:hypothetical protein n=1 Tax=Acinetobacter sp. ANC 4648 TaxID=1977875 RepID=UPI000A34EF7E|nr:hypothetical protein [Acinetobacter sp. ANC 4648]OTG83551.1 hypothetical protein B9T27_03270 [Acinetobacter sp. ANC 4648]